MIGQEAVEISLKSLGIAGAIIAVLMAVIVSLAGVIVFQYRNAQKVTGFRLSERDVLNKTLHDSTSTYALMLKAMEERNDINEDQSDLIAQQASSFELLKVTILAQFEHIKDSTAAIAQVVASIAEAQRNLNSMLQDNRSAVSNHVHEVKNAIVAGNQSVISEMRSALAASDRSRK